MNSSRELKIGSRPSKLALAQASAAENAIKVLDSAISPNIIPIKTSGDLKQGAVGVIKRDKKDWIIELESAIIREEIDLAVHSAKDVPLDIETGTIVRSILTRAEPNDAFIGRLQDGRRLKFNELPSGAVVGTASLRRRAQVLLARPDLIVKELRGNVPTRIQKLDQENLYDGIILAAAGLNRLGLLDDQIETLPVDLFVPASNQGILAVQFKDDRSDRAQLLERLTNSTTEEIFSAERECLRCLSADCTSAVAIHATEKNGELSLIAKVFSRTSSEFISSSASAPLGSGAELGKSVGADLLAKGAERLLIESRV